MLLMLVLGEGFERNPLFGRIFFKCKKQSEIVQETLSDCVSSDPHYFSTSVSITVPTQAVFDLMSYDLLDMIQS